LKPHKYILSVSKPGLSLVVFDFGVIDQVSLLEIWIMIDNSVMSLLDCILFYFWQFLKGLDCTISWKLVF
jgi:hypothetical protein